MQFHILTFNWHEPYICLLSRLGYPFTVVEPEIVPGVIRHWDENMRPRPSNVKVVSLEEARRGMDAGLFDLALCHNVKDLLFVREFSLPRILVFHNKLTTEIALSTQPVDRGVYLSQVRSLLPGVESVFISESKRQDWGFSQGQVILPGIDVAEYGGYTGERDLVLRVGNHFKERDLMLGYSVGEKIIGDNPGVILGQNPTIAASRLSRGFADLLEHYRTCRVYLHTTMEGYEDGYNLSMLEAMAVGMPVVALQNATSPIIYGINGYVSNDIDYLQKSIFKLLNYPEVAQQLGRRARQTVEEKFGMETFLNSWRKAVHGTAVKFLRNSGVHIKEDVTQPIDENSRKSVLMDYVSYPGTTAYYLERALRKQHDVITCGAVITPEIRKMWNLESLHCDAKPQDIFRAPGASIAQATIEIPENWCPDFYFWVETGLDNPPPDLATLTCPKVCYLIDTHLHLDRHIQLAKNFDIVLLAQRAYIPDFKAAGVEHAYWLPLACDPEIHGKVDAEKHYDVSFVGSLTPSHQRRKKLLDAIGAKVPLNIERKFLQDMALVFSESRIVFNEAIREDLNMRVFEALCSGSLLVTDAAPGSGLADFFQDRKHLAIYRDESVVDTIRHFLDHPEERERIAEEGRREVLAHHTYGHRVQSIIGILEGFLRQDTMPEVVPVEIEDKPVTYYRHVRHDVLRMIPESATCILEIGCATGRTGEYLKSTRKVFYAGVELNPIAATQAKDVLDDFIEGNIETLELPYAEKSFDCIVCADILEHLVNPADTLKKLRKYLKPDGVLVASLPNVQHLGVVHQLVEGGWTYQKEGILDETHLRFFTFKEMKKLFEEAGYDITCVEENMDHQFQAFTNSGQTTLKIGRMTITDLSWDEIRSFFVFQYKIAAKPKGVPVEEALDKMLVRAQLLEGDKKFNDAAQLFRRILQQDPESAEALAGLGNCHMNREEFDLAESLYRQVVAKNPFSVAGWFGLGAIRLHHGEHERAVEAFHRVLEHEFKHDQALLGLGISQWQLGRKQDAFTFFRKAIDVNPANQRAMRFFLDSARELGENEVLEQVLKEYLEIHPANTDMLFELADLHYRTHRCEEARSNLERILIFHPEHREALRLLHAIEQMQAPSIR